MNAGMPTRIERSERIVRAMLGIALLLGVAWALAGPGGLPGLDLHALLR